MILRFPGLFQAFEVAFSSLACQNVFWSFKAWIPCQDLHGWSLKLSWKKCWLGQHNRSSREIPISRAQNNSQQVRKKTKQFHWMQHCVHQRSQVLHAQFELHSDENVYENHRFILTVLDTKTECSAHAGRLARIADRFADHLRNIGNLVCTWQRLTAEEQITKKTNTAPRRRFRCSTIDRGNP